MDFDVEDHLSAMERSVSSTAGKGNPLAPSRFPAAMHDGRGPLWDALTNGERLAGWFVPITGDLTPGGRYQLEGNAGGMVTACERPSHLALTSEFGGDVSWVEVRFVDEGAGRARLTLTHTARLSEH